MKNYTFAHKNVSQLSNLDHVAGIQGSELQVHCD